MKILGGQNCGRKGIVRNIMYIPEGKKKMRFRFKGCELKIISKEWWNPDEGRKCNLGGTQEKQAQSGPETGLGRG